MLKKFTTGDSVVTRTGTKIMTINYQTKSGFYNCRWYDGMTLQESEFDPENLILKYRNSPVDTKNN